MSILNAQEQLQKMLDDQFVRQHPSVPSYAKPKPKVTKSPANQLTNDIIKFLSLKGHHVSRVNTMGVMRDGKYTRGGGTLGASDLSVIMKNKLGVVIAWELEIKIAKDKLSDVQIKYSESVIKAGGHYSVVKTFDDFFEQYNLLY